MKDRTRRIVCLAAVLLMGLLAPMQALAAQCDGNCGCNDAPVSVWNGSSDTAWYTETGSEFTITTAQQLAGLSKLSYEGVTFEGKTVKLGVDIDLKGHVFFPIDLFKGTFDGDGHTIFNMTMDTHTIDKRYIGLFRDVTNGTVKNLTMDGALLEPCGCKGDHYYCEMGIVAGMSNGSCVFENIRVMNSAAETYNNSVAGVVSETYGSAVFRNVQVDASNTIGSLWSSYDTRVGGILGYTGAAANVTFENCVSAPVLNVWNDVCSNYQWYRYRRSGMLIGEVTDMEHTTITVSNTTVAFGEWNQYTYCEFESAGKPSYASPGQWKFVRSDDSRCAPGHTHDEDETCTLLLPFTNLMGFDTGGEPVYEWPGVTVEDTNAYYFIEVENGSGSGIYAEGTQVAVTADYDCCAFKRWEVLAGDAADVASTDAAATLVTVSGFMRLKAVCACESTAAPKLPATGDPAQPVVWMAMAMVCVMMGMMAGRAVAAKQR